MDKLVGYTITLDKYSKDEEQNSKSWASIGRVLVSPKAYEKIKKIIEKDIKKVPENSDGYLQFFLPFYLQPQAFLKGNNGKTKLTNHNVSK